MKESMVDHLSTIKILLDAISRRRMVVATYNGAQMRLAPHQLFVRHESIYLSALNSEKKRLAEQDASVGHFNVTGLSNVVLIEGEFEPAVSFTGTPPRNSDRSIASITDD